MSQEYQWLPGWIPQGRTSTRGGDFLITSQLSGLVTTLTLQFAPLRGSHSGEYTCRSELRELSFNESASYSLTVDGIHSQSLTIPKYYGLLTNTS